MAASSIPLMGIAPPIKNEPAGQTIAQLMQIRAANDQNAIAQQQQQALDLENQQRQHTLDAQQALNDAYKASVTQGTDGMPVINHAAMAKTLAEKGWGSQVPGVMAGALKMQTEQAALAKDKLANAATSMEQQAQILQGIKALPPEQQEDAYQKALPGLQSAVKGFGLDPSAIAPRYDPATVEAYIGFGTKEADHARQVHEAADLAHRMATGLPKAAEDYATQYKTDISTASNQQDLDTKNQKWTAIAALDKTGLGANILKTLTVPTWTPDLAQQVRTELTPVAQRSKTAQEDLSAAAQSLHAAALQGPVAYTLAFDALSTDQRSKFTAPEKFDAAKTPDAVLEIGMTPEQLVSSKNQMKYREDMLGIRQQMLDLQDERLNGKNDVADKKQANKDFNASVAAESKLNGLRLLLGTAIAGNGQSYVNRLGEKIPMEKATAGGQTKDELLADMKNRYGQITQDLKTTLHNKYDAADRLEKKYSVGLEDSLKNLDQGDEQLFGVKNPAPATKPAPQRTAPSTAKNPVQPGQNPKPQASAPPPDTIASRVPEGRSIQSPDGALWKKVNGKMVEQPPAQQPRQ